MNNCIHSAITRMPKKIRKPERTNRCPKFSNRSSDHVGTAVLFCLLLAQLLIFGCASQEPAEQEVSLEESGGAHEKPQYMRPEWNLALFREMNSPVMCNAVLHVYEREGNATKDIELRYEAYILGDELRLDSHGADHAYNKTTVYKEGRKRSTANYLPDTEPVDCDWDVSSDASYPDSINAMMLHAHANCSLAEFGEEKFETPGRVCGSG